MGRDVIRMTNMVFYGYHGVAESERVLGGKFAVDVELFCDLSEAGKSDDLTNTVDYKAVYDFISHSQSVRRYMLIEALAHDIAHGLLRQFAVDAVTVRVRKNSVPLGGLIDHTEIEIHRTRDDLIE